MLGTLISQDGYQRVAFLVFNDTYGTGLRNFIQDDLKGAGGECVYGCKGEGDEFPAGQTTFSSEVTAALASNPDAIVVIAFDETKADRARARGAGLGHVEDLLHRRQPRRLQRGLRARAPSRALRARCPAPTRTQAFKDRANGWSESAEGETLTDYSYAAESYDAAILAALAAVKGGDTDSATVQKNFAAVSGATDGEECTTYADCVALLEEGDGDPLRRPVGHRSDQRARTTRPRRSSASTSTTLTTRTA